VGFLHFTRTGSKQGANASAAYFSCARGTPPVLVLAVAVFFADPVELVRAAPPSPILNNVFPAGGQAGGMVEVTLAGNGLENVSSILSHPGITSERVDNSRFRLAIDSSIPPGHYDIRAMTASGLSSPRSFIVSDRSELTEADENDTLETANPVSLDSVVNGRVEEAGDVDCFRFVAQRGQRVVIECFAERIDSPLRAVLEIFDASDRRLSVNRGFFGIDPLIAFSAPRDGEYRIRLFDLIYSGSADHLYRLEIDTGPRIAFAVPNVIQRGKTSRVRLYGWNLEQSSRFASTESHGDLGERVRTEAVLGDSPPSKIGAHQDSRTGQSSSGALESLASKPVSPEDYETLHVDLTAPDVPNGPIAFRLKPSQLTVDGFAYHHPGTNSTFRFGLTDVPVIESPGDHHSPATAEMIEFPCEICGQLIAGDEVDLYAIEARRGEVLWIEAFGDRINSPVDLDVSILDDKGDRMLARFSDERRNIGGRRFPSNHLDPAGRWLVPADGRYLILVRNLTGGLTSDPRRVYRLSIRREFPDVHLVVVPRLDDPATLNVLRGGRSVWDVIAYRGRGLTGAIRVSAKEIPAGLECPNVWLGPGVERAPLVVTASESAEPIAGTMRFEGHADSVQGRPVCGAAVVRAGTPNGWSRLTDSIALSVAGEAPVKITADGHETRPHHLYGDMQVRHSPGGILDVAVHVERRDTLLQAPVKLIGIGIPKMIQSQTATIAAEEDKGYISFYLPPTLPTGRYTIAIQGQTTVAAGMDDEGKQKTELVTVVSNPVTVDIEPAAFVVNLDPYAPRQIGRGEIVQVNYIVRRINGFIGKIHTELYAAEEVAGLRGRGVTSVGQTESGTIQIVANEQAALGQQPFLRLYAVGVLEDEAVFHGSCFLPLEIVE
jgi:hypothetical protein